MKKKDVAVGGTYAAKVSGKVVDVRIDAEHPNGGWTATNLATKKKVRIKSAQRLRGESPMAKGAERGKKHKDAVTAAKRGEAPYPEEPKRNDFLAYATGKAGKAKTSPVSKKDAKASKTPKTVKKADTAKHAAAGAAMSGLDAAARVLAGVEEPMDCGSIVEIALAKGYWQTKGKTPRATVYAAVIREIQKKGEAARFRKAGRGKFELARKEG